jgi:maltose/moltooligosaccharide transporter
MLDSQKRLSSPFYMLLSLPSTAMGTALSIQIAALSWILSTQYHLEIEEIGLVWAAGPIAGILGQVIIGLISDKVWLWNGRRRPFILIGGLLAALMLLALPNIDVISSSMGISGILGVAIAIALTLDLSINVSFNPTRSIIADVTPEGDARTKGYTWMQTVSGTFGMLTYGVGAVWGNYVLIYIGAVVVLAFSIIPPFFISEPRELTEHQESTDAQSSFKEMFFAIQPLWGFLGYCLYAIVHRLLGAENQHYYVEIVAAVVTLLLIGKALLTKEAGHSAEQVNAIGFKKVLAAHSFSWIGVQTMFVFMFAYLQGEFTDLDDDQLGKVISMSFLVLSAVSAVLPALVLEPLSRKFGRVRVHTVSLAIMALAYCAIFLFVESQISLYVCMAIAGIGWSAIISLPFAIMSEKVHSSKMGMYMGLFNLSVVLPQLVASTAVGMIVGAATDKSMVFLVSAVTLAISAACWWLVSDNSGANKQEVQDG